jgi:hypothetical protein
MTSPISDGVMRHATIIIYQHHYISDVAYPRQQLRSCHIITRLLCTSGRVDKREMKILLTWYFHGISKNVRALQWDITICVAKLCSVEPRM